MSNVSTDVSITIGGEPVDVRESNFFIGTALKTYQAYGRYMVFGKGKYYTENGLYMDEVVAIAPTTLTYINTDPLNGELIAVYTADLYETERSGDVYEVIALSHTPEAIPMTAVCFVGAQKGRMSGKVSFTVKITVDSLFMSFVGGRENKLVNFLLGNGYDIVRFSTKYGNVNYPNVPIKRDTSKTNASESSILFSMTAEGMTFRVGMATGYGNEILLLADGVPVIRVLPYETQRKTATVALSANDAGYVLVNTNSMDMVLTLKQNNSFIEGSKIVNLPQTMSMVKELLPFKVSAGTKIIADPLNEFLGFVTENEIIVVQLDLIHGTKMMLRRCHQNAYVAILAGGSVVISEKEKTDIFFYDQSANKYTEARYSLGKGVQTTVLMELSGIHFAKIEDGKLKRYKLLKGNNEPQFLAEKTVSASGKLFRDHTHIIYAEDSGAATCCNFAGEDESRAAVIGVYFFDLGTPITWQVGEGCVFMQTTDMILLGYTYVFDGSELEVGDNPQLFGNILVSKKGGNYSVFFADYVHASMPECFFPADKPVTNALRVGDHLVVLFNDGSLSTYYLNCIVQGVYNPMLTSGKVTLSYRYKERFLYGKSYTFAIKLLFTRGNRH